MPAADPGINSQETLELVASDLYGGAEEEVFQVIRNPGELNKFYRKVNMTRKPGLPVPNIDFTKHTAVLYCSGTTTVAVMPKMYVSGQIENAVVLKKDDTQVLDNSDPGTAKLTPFGLYLLPYTEKQVILNPEN